jgi:hypothetical protein
VLGTMLNFLNLKRVNTSGIEQVNKHVMMAALTYNLKKLLKWNSRVRIGVCSALEIPGLLTAKVRFSTVFCFDKLFSIMKPKIFFPLYSAP